MAEPAGLWSFRNLKPNKEISVTQNVILSYARVALQTLITRIDVIHHLTKLSGNQNVYIHPELPSLLSDIVFHQGVVSLLIFRDGEQGRQESNLAYASRLERIAYVANRCEGLPFPALKSRRVRNALTHLDEYLAEELAAPNTGWFIDVAVRSRNDFGRHPEIPNISYARSYIIDSDTLLNFGEEINLGELKKEAELAVGAIWRATDVGHYSGPLYDLVVTAQPYRLRLLEWWRGFPLPNLLVRAKDDIVNRFR
jgi:hypothetical protein